MKTRRWIALAFLCTTLALVLRPNAAQAQSEALLFSNDGGFVNGYTGTLGWQFTANQNVTLTDFGIYNAGLPVITAHQVGLFDLSGDLLDSGSVGPTSSDTVDGFFDFAPATQYNLVAGQSYIIGELLGPSDYYYYDPSSITTDPSTSYVQTQYDPANTNSLTFPSVTDFPSNGYGYFGPNFMVEGTVTPTATPEPSNLAFLAALLGAVPLWQRRGGRTGMARRLLGRQDTLLHS